MRRAQAEMPLVVHGRAWKFGDHINTDLIFPSSAFKLPRHDQHRLAFHAVRPGWVEQVSPGDFIIGGENFGMGSGRPVGAILRACGIAAVLAASVNDLCLRNCINAGLPAATFADAEIMFEDGDLGTIDFIKGQIINRTRHSCAEIPVLAPEMASIIEAGGLINMLQTEGLIETASFVAAGE